MKIALTGGSGGLGQVIEAEALSQGHQVVSIDRTAPPKTTSSQACNSSGPIPVYLTSCLQVLRAVMR